MTVPQSIQEQLQAIAPSAIIELFELELTEAVNGINEDYYYHAGTNGIVENITFDGVEYTAFPIEVDGFDSVTARGTLQSVQP